MRRGIQRTLAVAATLGLMTTAGCATFPVPPDAVGADYPGTCLPAELSWPSDFIESLPSESAGVGGAIVGLRLEYTEDAWAWRVRTLGTRHDFFGEPVDDPGFGIESMLQARTLETLATHEVRLTEAEQRSGTSAYDAAQRSGEEWPSPLIVEMARAMDDGAALWRITMCDTATNELSVLTLP